MTALTTISMLLILNLAREKIMLAKTSSRWSGSLINQVNQNKRRQQSPRHMSLSLSPNPARIVSRKETEVTRSHARERRILLVKKSKKSQNRVSLSAKTNGNQIKMLRRQLVDTNIVINKSLRESIVTVTMTRGKTVFLPTATPERTLLSLLLRNGTGKTSLFTDRTSFMTLVTQLMEIITYTTHMRSLILPCHLFQSPMCLLVSNALPIP